MTVFFICLFTLITAVVWWKSMSEEKRLAKRFADRQNQTPEDFYNRYYAKAGLNKERVQEIVGYVADSIGLPTGKLLPSDRFTEELAPIEFDSGIGPVMTRLLTLAQKAGKTVDTRTIDTLDDYIRAAEPVWS